MIDTDTLRKYLDSPVEDDDVIEAFEASAQKMVEQHTGYLFDAAGNVTEYLYGMGTNALFLTRNPTADPTAVTERAQIGDAGTVITAAQSDGWVRLGSRLLRKGGSEWTLGYQYEVTYPGGYELNEEPGDVRAAVLRITGVLYRQRGSEGIASESLEDYTFRRQSEEIEEILAQLPRRGVMA